MQKAHPSFKAPGPGPIGVLFSGCHGPCAQPLAAVPSLGLAGSPHLSDSPRVRAKPLPRFPQ